MDYHGAAVPGPAGHPRDCKAVLISAFAAKMDDPDLVREPQQHLDIAPSSSAQIHKFLADICSTPQSLVQRAARIIAQGNRSGVWELALVCAARRTSK
jgi:hypothetical protein